jgi:quinol-cytochrome oxidoreductase complex cytochrome b subunit
MPRMPSILYGLYRYKRLILLILGLLLFMLHVSIVI